jgi:chromosome segregation ATPase
MHAALAYKPEYDEVPVSSIEVLESNVIAMRGELTELKTDVKDFRKEFSAAVARLDNDIKTAVARLDSDIKAAVAELRAEIRAVAAKAESDLKAFADRVESQFAEMRAEDRSLRDRIDKNHALLSGKIDATNARIDITNEKLAEIGKSVDSIGNKLNAFFWVVGGLIAIATFAITVGKAVGWF